MCIFSPPPPAPPCNLSTDRRLRTAALNGRYMADLRIGTPRNRGSIQSGGKKFSSSRITSRPALQPTQVPVHPSVPAVFLTSLSRFLLEKLTGPQLVKKFPEFYGTRRFITAFASARHLSLSWASSIQSSSPCPYIPLPEVTSWYYPPIYAKVSHMVSLPQFFPPKSCIRLSSPP